MPISMKKASHETHFYAWSHPVCSVKLASQEFNLDKYDECIHLTNASIQQKYFHQNSNENLPNHHMWNLGTFILYLENEYGKGDVWDKSIFPEINRSLRKIAHSMAYHTELTPGRFEIFGCDWIITEDFKPYLLEINRPPCLGIYSPVSVSVCGKICEDLVKVVVDRMMNGEEDTGEFEIIYQAKIDDLKRGSLRRASTVSMASDKGSHIFNRRFSML
uniref:CSON014047 protein n=1 Tax=Culicoides sonorensis TaxID=179676 RepID=A0A336MF73_CULSO